jgi:hypothetical protein
MEQVTQVLGDFVRYKPCVRGMHKVEWGWEGKRGVENHRIQTDLEVMLEWCP